LYKKPNSHPSDFTYKFCWAGTAQQQADCPPTFLRVHDILNVKNHVKPIAKQLRFAMIDHLDFCPIFDYFTNTSIDISIFSPHPVARPNLTVPIDFLHGNKFGETHLGNLTLRFNDTHSANVVTLSNVTHLDLHNVTIDKTVHDSLAPKGCADAQRIAADPYSYAQLLDRCVPELLVLDEGKFDQIVFGNDRILLNHSTELTVLGTGYLNVTRHDGRPAYIEVIYHALDLRIDVAPGTTHIPQTLIFQPDIPGQPNYTFNERWTPALAGNLTIDNLLGYFYVSTNFVPFRPGFLIRTPSSEQSGIRIHAAGSHQFPDGVRIYYPFPDYARLNPGSWGELLRFEDIEFVQPMSLDGDIDRAIFAGHIKFDMAAGINVHDATFDTNNPPTINIDFRLQGGLPRIYLGTTHSPMTIPYVVNLIHRGESEKAFIQRHPVWFRRFSHEILCGNESLPCAHWRINFVHNASEDSTIDHDSGGILRAVCRQENEGVQRTCLAIEIDEYYFPLPSPSIAATWTPYPTFPPLPTQPRTRTPTHTDVHTATPYEHPRTPSNSPYRSPIRTRSWLTGGTPWATDRLPSDQAGGGSVTVPSAGGGSNIGAGIAIGIVVALVVVGVAGAIVYFFVLRPRTARDGYDNVDLDAKLGVSL
jgi:hypothetical protein